MLTSSGRPLPTQPGRNIPFVMPKYRGTDIADLLPEVARLKRQGHLEAALSLAEGCQQAMVQAASADPQHVMERYVIEVALIQHRLERFDAEISTIESWLATGLPAARADHRVELHKRLAKAREQLAKQRGEDCREHTARWKQLVAEEKLVQASMRGTFQSSSGRSAANPAQRRPRSGARLIPPVEELLEAEFVAVDFETANRKGGVSACQVALVRVQGGRVVEKYDTFLRPPSGWDHFEFTYLHGISRRETQDAPTWVQAAPTVQDFVGTAPVYAHNATFDARVWRDLDQYFSLRTVPTRFFCTYRMARRALPGLENYKLPTVVRRCSPQFQLDHHRAGSDAEACALIVAALQTDERALAALR